MYCTYDILQTRKTLHSPLFVVHAHQSCKTHHPALKVYITSVEFSLARFVSNLGERSSRILQTLCRLLCWLNETSVDVCCYNSVDVNMT